MAVYNTYVQQLRFDGISYEAGPVADLLNDFRVVCQEFPFKKDPKPKDLPTRDWPGEDGLDVYIPPKIPMASYDVEVTFLYVGTEKTIQADLADFIDFLYGRNAESKGGRLAIYNEGVGMGRKDVVAAEVENELFYLSDNDIDAVATFRVKFTVYDPTTEVTPARDMSNKVTSLTFD